MFPSQGIEQKTKKAAWWPEAGQVDLESQAFGERGKPNLAGARSRLVDMIDEDSANAHSQGQPVVW
jgi:hypothetical protein